MTRAALLATVMLSVAMIAFGQQTAVALGDKTEAGSCAIANSGSASGNSVTCNFGLTPEQLKQATEAAVKGATGPLIDRIVDISKTLGVTEDAAKTLLKIVGDDPNVPDDKLAEALTKVAGDFKRLQAQAAVLNPDNPLARSRVDEARSEIDAGHLQHAHELLHAATQAQIAAAEEARTLKEQAQTAENVEMLGAARSTATEGNVALTEGRYLEAAELFAQAAGYVPGGDTDDRGGYLWRQAEALYRQGEEHGGAAALQASIEVYGRVLAEYPRSQAPFIWAATQNERGIALQVLGERESDTARLEEAAAAFRAALEVWTRERVPLDWARTQMNLGNTLTRLAERERGTARLQEAVAAYQAALEEQTREQVPLGWAMTQMNLGTALEVLGERERGTARLDEAVAAFRAALEERTRERVPLDWAMTQMSLGNALEVLGQRENGAARLEEAVAAYRAALEEVTRERVPLDWAMTQNNLGTALRLLGERESGTARLEEAVADYRAALEEWTRERVPFDWARAQAGLGAALQVLGERKTGTAQLEDAVAAFRAALEEQTRERVPFDWARSFGGQGVALSLIADRTHDAVTAGIAMSQIETACETLRALGDEASAAYFEAQLTQARAIRERLTSVAKP
jgi:tetratricopeptide (TPR) repeat protein